MFSWLFDALLNLLMQKYRVSILFTIAMMGYFYIPCLWYNLNLGLIVAVHFEEFGVAFKFGHGFSPRFRNGM